MVSSTPQPHFTPRKDPVPILQGAGWPPGTVWTGRKSRPQRDSIPDHPARSQSLYRLSYPAHTQVTDYSNDYSEVHCLLHNSNVGIVLSSKVRIASISAYHVLLYSALNIAPEVLLLFWLHLQTPATIKKMNTLSHNLNTMVMVVVVVDGI